jgi:hypothetical protein
MHVARTLPWLWREDDPIATRISVEPARAERHKPSRAVARPVLEAAQPLFFIITTAPMRSDSPAVRHCRWVSRAHTPTIDELRGSVTSRLVGGRLEPLTPGDGGGADCRVRAAEKSDHPSCRT